MYIYIYIYSTRALLTCCMVDILINKGRSAVTYNVLHLYNLESNMQQLVCTTLSVVAPKNYGQLWPNWLLPK